MTHGDHLQRIADAVVAFEEDAAARACRQALDAGLPPVSLIERGLSRGMERVGELYARGEYYVPELLLCSDAFYAGLETIRPCLARASGDRDRSIVLGVMAGDIHDIGKNLVRTMFDAAGWEVHDLGRDVPVGQFLDALNRTGARTVGLSALMTTSMLAMPDLIAQLREAHPGLRVLVGGAPLDAQLARDFGADAYAPDCVTAVETAGRLLAPGGNPS